MKKLKIKGNILSGELEKFGFEKHGEIYRICYGVNNFIAETVIYFYDGAGKDDRVILISSKNDKGFKDLGVLFDLFEAGILEVIEE